MINFKFALSEEDYLTHQLYTASVSDAVKKQRNKIKWALAVIFVILGSLRLFLQDFILGGIFVVVGVLLYFLYPIRQKYFYKKHYLNHVRTAYGEKFGLKNEVSIDEEKLSSKTEMSEGVYYTSHFENLIELPQHFLIKLKTKEHIIIPKAHIEDQAEFKRFILSLGVAYVDELNWEWK